MIQKVEDVQTPLIVGKEYLVPCLIIKEFSTEEKVFTKSVVDEEDVWRDDYDRSHPKLRGYYRLVRSERIIVPIIKHLHSDKENGQFDAHYHIDTRFRLEDNSHDIIRPNNKYELRYLSLECVMVENLRKTDVSLISKSKLKHKCIKNGKCPHRGMNLSQVPEINGVITCPLHSLQFDAKTKQLIQ